MGAEIDLTLTPCDGTSSAQNKCVIRLTTDKDYVNNVKWSRNIIGNDDGDYLLEPGEQIEIHVNIFDLGDNKTLSDNITVNDFFNMQVKPAIGSTITIQRTMPPALDLIIDLH
ncbi:MAG: hypothetical protein JXA01_09835 [Dehalococcoidia bacterium]|nr:hypothetical protein [Dehalococcoidia bacterium]